MDECKLEKSYQKACLVRTAAIGCPRAKLDGAVELLQPV